MDNHQTCKQGYRSSVQKTMDDYVHNIYIAR